MVFLAFWTSHFRQRAHVDPEELVGGKFLNSHECIISFQGVDDQICLTYPTTLFVVGEDAQNVNMKALRRLRKNMIGK